MKITILALAILAAFLGGMLIGAQKLGFIKATPPRQTTAQAVPIKITLQHAQVLGDPQVYSVKQGDILELTIVSDRTGTIGVPVDPPQKIAFTQSSLVFRMTASSVGRFPLSFQATGRDDVILIGTIEVQNK